MSGRGNKMNNFSGMMRAENTCVIRFRNEGEFKNPNIIEFYLSKKVLRVIDIIRMKLYYLNLIWVCSYLMKCITETLKMIVFLIHCYPFTPLIKPYLQRQI